ncbi:MAG: methylated-DNA--[protein]-cysteine S-methyltransferase [Alphaproteobacteria bacterium]|uniref:Methylated-DNA--protein-cysteine methyltransferase n=1 Tax=Candidatus Nitrobium versatile TaxID=2884831 RepID=A0A953LVD2_9BACT|nr:methylated-DNA--[protein]-cysteine S-methyltransferase [Candidatus Nitrobium versatile]
MGKDKAPDEIGGRKVVPAARRNEAARSFFRELDAYFDGTLKEFRQAVRFLRGTDFERRVWDALKEIPYGETRTYGWMADRVGSPGAARAAGRALGRNPLPILIPCHRVIGADGSLTGFSCGVEIKKWLLEHEQQGRREK